MDDFEKFYNKALRFLSFRPRSEKEIRDYLKIKNQRSKIKNKAGIDESIIGSVIEKLKEQNFINDLEFAKWWIESRVRFKPRSMSLIKRELLQKGVDREIIDAQISNFQFPISNELENAKKLIEKKLPRYKNLSKQEIYQKLGSFLGRRGFDWETIKKAIDPAERG